MNTVTNRSARNSGMPDADAPPHPEGMSHDVAPKGNPGIRRRRGRVSARKFVILGGCLAAGASGASAMAPASTPILRAVAPATAEAFGGGRDRDHWWIKVTRGEIAQGATAGICARFVPIGRTGQVCTPIAQSAKQAVGNSNGVWAEVWPPVCYYRWVWVRPVVTHCDGARIRMGTW